METITIQLPAHVVHELKQRAQELRMPIDILVHASVVDFLDSPDEEFERLIGFLLQKNHELYERLK